MNIREFTALLFFLAGAASFVAREWRFALLWLALSATSLIDPNEDLE